MAERAGSFTHLDRQGHARMVDVTGKAVTARRALARAVVHTSAEVAGVFAHCDPDPLVAARVAGVQAAKRTAELIPLCHPLPVSRLLVEVHPGDHRIEVTALAEVVERTGVEMEALTACAVAGLSLVAALKGADPAAWLDELTLWHKSGGRSGTWERTPAGGTAG